MTLTPGQRIGPYEIVDAIGAGGMGEVYRARDTTLHRDVALKVLHASIASDPERLARFRREAQVLASLNHPHIAQIYGFEEGRSAAAGGPGQAVPGRGGAVHALIMELVDGTSLDAIVTGAGVPLETALPIARQIADALEAAHEQGIIHRDLKPANVRVRADGTVKVLDFGLAKAMIAATTSKPSESPTMMSPVELSPAMTQQGAILGTAAYMSPEQARGRTVDRRADIWAFGCVLFEMLTGRTLFGGESVADAFSAIMHREPEWTSLPPGVGPRIRAMLRRCLQKDARLRLRDIGEARVAIDDVIAGGDAPERAPAARPDSLAFALSISLPPGCWLPLDEAPAFAMSRDGRVVVFVAVSRDGRQLFRRDLGRFGATPIPGTTGASGPFLSPDGRRVGFFADNLLKRASLDGGTATTLCEVSNLPRGASWTPGGRIVFAPLPDCPLMHIPDTGGAPKPLTRLDTARAERSHRWPEVTPDGRSVVFTIGLTHNAQDYDGCDIGWAPLDTGETRVVFHGARMARTASPGEILVQRRSTLLRASFDRSGAAQAAAAQTVVEGVAGDASSGSGYFCVGGGLLAYAPVSAVALRHGLFIVDRAGQATRLQIPAKGYRDPRVSADGRRIAVHIGDDRDLDARGTRGDVWILDIATRRLSRLTTGGVSSCPCWSPDSRRVAFFRSGAPGGVYVKPVDGGRAETALWVSPSDSIRLPEMWRPDGSSILVQNIEQVVGLWFVSPDGGEPAPFGPDGGDRWGAAFSPDGTLLAYTSVESGVAEVFVEALAEDGGRWQVSSEGGMFPVWSADGRELVFVCGDTVMAVAIETSPTLQIGLPAPLFKSPFELRTPPVRNFDMLPDGRFIMVGRVEDGSDRPEICVVSSAPADG